MSGIPAYIKDAAAFRKAPREANLDWFRGAKRGFFMHYGLYTLLGVPDWREKLRAMGVTAPADMDHTTEWVQFFAKIPIGKYELLSREFTAEKFNADEIVSFARSRGFDYITFTTRHHDSFCLFDSVETDFTTLKTAAKRDLTRELYEACERQGMALFLYYSHGRDWRHPHAPNNDEWGGNARPAYDPPEPSYKTGAEHQLCIYTDFVKKQILELIALCPNAAGIWLDGIAVPLSGERERFNVPDLYEAIRAASPHILISYKQGLTGGEDFFAPEINVPPELMTSEKPVEVCATMIVEPGSWCHIPSARHLSAQEVRKRFRAAEEGGYRLLLNSGPMPDGSLDLVDVSAITEAVSLTSPLRPDGE